MSAVTLAQASTIVDAALKKARESNLAPLAVAVLDSGGHLVAFKREDKSVAHARESRRENPAVFHYARGGERRTHCHQSGWRINPRR